MRAWWKTGARARTSGTASKVRRRGVVRTAWRCCSRPRKRFPKPQHDQAALELVLRKRQDKTRAFFDDMAGRLGREYVPGRSWKSIAEALLLLLPPMVIADLGAGEGAFSLLLAQRAQQVIAVDNSDKMVELGSALARKQGVPALEYRKGDLEAVPIADGSVDLALFSQSLHHALHPGARGCGSLAHSEARRTDRDPGSGAAPFCRGAGSYMPTSGWASAKWSWSSCWARPASEMCTPPWCTKKQKRPSFRPCWLPATRGAQVLSSNESRVPHIRRFDERGRTTALDPQRSTANGCWHSRTG